MGISSTGSALIAAESEIKKERGEEGGGEAGSKKEKNRGNFHLTNEDGGGNIRDKEEGDSESKDNAKPTAGGFAGKAGYLKDAVVAEEDRFGLDDPEGERDKSEKEGVVDEKTSENKKKISESVGEGGGNGEGVRAERTTMRAMPALASGPISRLEVLTRNWGGAGLRRRKSSPPVRTRSGSLTRPGMRKAVKICWISWLVATRTIIS